MKKYVLVILPVIKRSIVKNVQNFACKSKRQNTKENTEKSGKIEPKICVVMRFLSTKNHHLI